MDRDRPIPAERAQARPPISSHPAFPLIVGLWFGALFGLGTIVMPAVVLEKAATVSGLSLVWPAAEPPLSAGARAALSLLMTIAGLIAGLVLARRVVASQMIAHAPRRRTPAPAAKEPARRPISAHEELGEDAIGTPEEPQRPPIAGRRRALAVDEEYRPSDYLLTTPLPGIEAPVRYAAPADEEEMSEHPIDREMIAAPAAPETAADSGGPAPGAPAQDAAPKAPPENAQVFGAPTAREAAPQEPPAQEPKADAVPDPYVPALDTRKPRPASAPAPRETVPAPQPRAEVPPPPLAATAPRSPALDGELDELGMVQLVERLGRSLQQRAAAAPAPEPEAGLSEASPEPAPLSFTAPSLEAGPGAEEQAIRVPPPVVPEALQAFMGAEPAAEKSAPPAGPRVQESPDLDLPAAPPVPTVPAALRPYMFDEPEDEDQDLGPDPGPLSLPLSALAPRPFDAPRSGPDEAEEDTTEDEADEDGGYSSLLAMKNPFRPREEFVRVDLPEPELGAAEPAVVFPGQEERQDRADAEPENAADNNEGTRPFDRPAQPEAAPAPSAARPRASDPAETDRALRAALANLQRMSGAA